MPPSEAVTDIIPAYDYAPASRRRERHPVKQAILAAALAVTIPVLVTEFAVCVKIIWVVWG
jgi:hypothetical protein